MSLPALLNEMVDRIFFYLHYALNDELVIQAFESLEIVIIGVASFFLLGKRYPLHCVLTPSYSATHWCSLVLVCTAVMSMEIGSASSRELQSAPPPSFPHCSGWLWTGRHLRSADGEDTEEARADGHFAAEHMDLLVMDAVPVNE